MKYVIGLFLVGIVGCSGTPPQLGIKDGELLPCSSKPNCVSTQSKDPERLSEPLRYADSADAAKARLHKILENYSRTTFVEEKTDYWRLECKSLIFRYVDDVEFFFTPGVIHFRSASRMGYSDLGVNRRRMETIREQFAAKP